VISNQLLMIKLARLAHRKLVDSVDWSSSGQMLTGRMDHQWSKRNCSQHCHCIPLNPVIS